MGNGLVTTRHYGQEGWIQSIVTGKEDQELQHLAYDVEPGGNIRSRQDLHLDTHQWESFTYDHLDRLVCSMLDSGPIGHASYIDKLCYDPESSGVLSRYDYDDLGRLKSREGLGTYSYGAFPVHAPSNYLRG